MLTSTFGFLLVHTYRTVADKHGLKNYNPKYVAKTKNEQQLKK